jgi:hypothetical protein
MCAESTALVIPVGDRIKNALRFWEPMRAAYNGVLIVVAVVEFTARLPKSRESLRADSFVALFALTVVANILYSVAYAIDVPLQIAEFGGQSRRWRWALWTIGTLFAAALAHFMLSGLFAPYVD